MHLEQETCRTLTCMESSTYALVLSPPRPASSALLPPEPHRSLLANYTRALEPPLPWALESVFVGSKPGFSTPWCCVT